MTAAAILPRNYLHRKLTLYIMKQECLLVCQTWVPSSLQLCCFAAVVCAPCLHLCSNQQSCRRSGAPLQDDALWHVGVKTDVGCFHGTTFLNCQGANTSTWSTQKKTTQQLDFNPLRCQLSLALTQVLREYKSCWEDRPDGRIISIVLRKALTLQTFSRRNEQKHLLRWVLPALSLLPAPWYANLTTRSWAGALQLAIFLYQFW